MANRRLERPACPECGEHNSAVTNSYATELEGYITRVRRRRCKSCDYRWSTYEMTLEDLTAIRLALAARLVAAVNEVVSKEGLGK